MNDQWARHIRLRLVAHWPSLGGDANDPAAMMRLEDWLRTIQRCNPEVASEALELLIQGHEGYPPTIGDWQAVCRSVASRHALERSTVERQALEAGAQPDAKERIAALIQQARANVDAARKKNPARTAARQPISKYDPVPIKWGHEGSLMTEEDRLAELEAFGGRTVRKRTP